MNASAINGDLSRRIEVDSSALEWSPSPGGEVLRKRLHHVGPPENGQVTSLVRYRPGSRFPAHAHPDGEEILVLEGVFSDEQGDWPAGSYLLNPEGFSHSPHSEPGCLLFVKLRQYPGKARRQLAVDTSEQAWLPSVRRGVRWKKLYAQPPFSDHARLERWSDPGSVGQLHFPHGAELLVLRGGFGDEHGEYGLHHWLRLPPGSQLTPHGDEACELYIKEGGFPYLLEG